MDEPGKEETIFHPSSFVLLPFSHSPFSHSGFALALTSRRAALYSAALLRKMPKNKEWLVASG
jgi:hypothetical protein